MAHLTRRELLENSLFAAAAAAVAGPISLVRADEKPQSKSPNERLSVAVVGVRGRGGSHIGSVAGRDDAEVTYICDADSNVGQRRAAKVAEHQGREPKFVQDMREVFDDPSVDIVTIATPNHWHSLCAIWAVQAGKDVYVEKPVSHNVSEGRRVVEAAGKYGRICQTGTQIRSSRGIHEAFEFMNADGIGDVKLARGLCYKRRRSIGAKGNYDVPAGVDYNLWCGPGPMNPLTRPNLHYDWHWTWDYGNGDLGNQGIHQMDLARWGLGLDHIGYGVVSYGGRLGYEDAGETANTQVSIHDYGDKTLVFEVRGLETDKLKGTNVGDIFYGSDGYLVVPSYSSAVAFDPSGNQIRKFSGGGDHFGNFIDAVRSRNAGDLNSDILEGHLSSALCHLGNVSYRLGEKVTAEEARKRLGSGDEAQSTFQRVTAHLEANGVSLAETTLQFGRKLAIDPSSETFVDNGEADHMLTREYRAPFVVPAAGKV